MGLYQGMVTRKRVSEDPMVSEDFKGSPTNTHLRWTISSSGAPWRFGPAGMEFDTERLPVHESLGDFSAGAADDAA